MLALDDLDVVVAADTQTSNGAVPQRVTLLLVGLASAISSATEATDPVLCDEAHILRPMLSAFLFPDLPSSLTLRGEVRSLHLLVPFLVFARRLLLAILMAWSLRWVALTWFLELILSHSTAPLLLHCRVLGRRSPVGSRFILTPFDRSGCWGTIRRS